MSDALEIYLKDMKINRILIKYFGLDVLSEDLNINFMTFFVIIDLVLFNLSQMYSDYYFRDNFSERIFSLMTWPFGVLVGFFVYFIVNIIQFIPKVFILFLLFCEEQERWCLLVLSCVFNPL